jgi:hypothetical protein
LLSTLKELKKHLAKISFFLRTQDKGDHHWEVREAMYIFRNGFIFLKWLSGVYRVA